VITKKQIVPLPSTFGVYLFKKDNEVLYVGKSNNIKARVKSHLENAKLDRKEYLIVSQSTTVETVTTESEFKALILEAELIKKYLPKYNVIWRDNKSYLYIKITIKENFPKIYLSRKEHDPKSLYFGPFGSYKTASELLSDVRHIIPFCTQRNLDKRSCFYSKIGLCDPCPNTTLDIKDKRTYKKNINKVIKIFNGHVEIIIRDFYKQLRKFTKDKKFEEAIIIRNKIIRLERLLHFSLSRQETSNIESHTKTNELQELLKSFFPELKNLLRIEAYDISNLGDSQIVASMVVATDGYIDKSQYRKFKIKNKSSLSDFDRLREVITRRFKQDWKHPDLIVIDGGRPQVLTTMILLNKIDIKIPIIGIAKNPDRLVVGTPDMITIKPELNNQGFNLVRLLRDESHRFARKYHLFLREKDFLI